MYRLFSPVHGPAQNTLLSGGNDALGPIGPNAPLEDPPVDFPQCNVNGQRAKKYCKAETETLCTVFCSPNKKHAYFIVK